MLIISFVLITGWGERIITKRALAIGCGKPVSTVRCKPAALGLVPGDTCSHVSVGPLFDE